MVISTYSAFFAQTHIGNNAARSTGCHAAANFGYPVHSPPHSAGANEPLNQDERAEITSERAIEE